MFRPIEKPRPICLTSEEVIVHAGLKVLMEVDDSISLIIGNLQEILGQQLRPRQSHLLKNIKLNISKYIINFFF
jgi:hypothetical protein